MNANEIIIPCRLSYANIWEARQSMEGDKMQYSCCLLIPKSDTATVQRIQAMMAKIEAEAVGPVARKTSARLITSFTGAPPALRDSASASGSIKMMVLPPKPPPISEGVTRSCEASVPRTAAHMRRIYH